MVSSQVKFLLFGFSCFLTGFVLFFMGQYKSAIFTEIISSVSFFLSTICGYIQNRKGNTDDG